MTQVDLPTGRSGMTHLERTLSGIDGLAFVRMSSMDVVRHRIVQDIVDAYERADTGVGIDPGTGGGRPPDGRTSPAT
jgi:phosphate starvation-inducible PhoH-like protein